MSGMEIIGVASGIITFLSACIELTRAAEDASGLPPAFRDAAARLPLISDSFALARQGLETDQAEGPNESLTSLKTLLQSAEAKALVLRDLFAAVVPAAEMSRPKRYLQALKTIPKADSVEKLVDGITRDLQALTANYVIKSAARAQIGHNLEQMTENYSGEGLSVSLRNTGSGKQFVYSGIGNQNVATGKAVQVNGATHESTFNFVQK
ncbi:unnamed protein product [Clonostachys rosea]|uniref:NACHT-NTPase and P-loop NTPases N-terminal domain-containing protein n=1 Tax=Bionectria ochroleuca TaxID=29856 RepID=A0ABY6U751_BIOOC|nr:unnamed protein product [Clonostachys rosea]